MPHLEDRPIEIPRLHVTVQVLYGNPNRSLWDSCIAFDKPLSASISLDERRDR
ncbi:hypothetical protein P3T40_001469 [Paraburkholderia sp. EB58]|jgi:hypothetical protein